jgi:glycosyltransferase involved in cell wall biosynthesis
MSPRVTLVGRPFRPTASGERLRSVLGALVAAGVEVRLRDVSTPWEPVDPGVARGLRHRLVERLDGDVTLLVGDGAERDLALDRLGPELGEAARLVAYVPAEPGRPRERWATELARCQEVWAASVRSGAALGGFTDRPVAVLPPPCHPSGPAAWSRRHFGVSETAYAFVLVLDLASPVAPLNPLALLEVLDRVKEARPYIEFQAVLRLENAGADPATVARIKLALEPHRRQVLLLDAPITADQLSSLIRVGNAFVALDGIEDFSVGPGEAMYFGRPVVAAAPAGTVDYLTHDTALCGDAPESGAPAGTAARLPGPACSDPDLDRVAGYMVSLLDDPDGGRVIGARASAHVRTHFSQLACGLRYAARLAGPVR